MKNQKAATKPIVNVQSDNLLPYYCYYYSWPDTYIPLIMCSKI